MHNDISMETPMDKNPVIAYYDSIAAHYDNAAAEVAASAATPSPTTS